jgi:hypothetical protein
MSTTEAQAAGPDARVRKVAMKLEVHVIPDPTSTDSTSSMNALGWRLDDDVAPVVSVRNVQFTPAGSGTSVTFGKGLTAAAPGSARAGLIVSDIEAAHGELVVRGIDASDVWHGPPFPPTLGNPASIPSAPAMGRSSPSTIPTAICGWSRRSRRGSPAGSTRWHRVRVDGGSGGRASACRGHGRARAAHGAAARGGAGRAGARRGPGRLVRVVHGGGAGRDRAYVPTSRPAQRERGGHHGVPGRVRDRGAGRHAGV